MSEMTAFAPATARGPSLSLRHDGLHFHCGKKACGGIGKVSGFYLWPAVAVVP
jgi:hypothetical protein